MTAEEKDFMERYIYQVIRRMPKEQRDDVRMELEELISDMYSDKGSMEQVLTELGDPAVFARQYQTGPHYLIGPDYYDNFVWAVRVCLICVAAMTFFVSVYSVFAKNPADQYTAGVIISRVMEGFSKGFEPAVMGCISAFGVITLLFALLERQKVRLDEKKDKAWSVDELKKGARAAAPRWTPAFLDPVPDKRAVISRGNSICGIAVLSVLSVLVIFAPELFAAYVTSGDEQIAVPIFNLDKWSTIMPLFAVSLLVSLTDEFLRLVMGRYCRPVMVSAIITSAVTIILDAIVLKVLPIWNPDFGEEIVLLLNQTGDTADLAFFENWNAGLASDILLAVIVFFTLVELGVTIYKTLRYDVTSGPRKQRS